MEQKKKNQKNQIKHGEALTGRGFKEASRKNTEEEDRWMEREYTRRTDLPLKP